MSCFAPDMWRVEVKRRPGKYYWKCAKFSCCRQPSVGEHLGYPLCVYHLEECKADRMRHWIPPAVGAPYPYPDVKVDPNCIGVI